MPSISVTDETSTIHTQTVFIPIQKIDKERREVWGYGTREDYDQANEIMDFATSLPYFQRWTDMSKARSGGKSMGNLRAMHGNTAAGKLVAFNVDHANKGFYVGAHVVDDQEWKKVEAGVYTGFSIGGNYVKRWPDQFRPGAIRYTADPKELSLVDAPCLPGATFDVIKADGIEQVAFQSNGTNTAQAVIDVEPEDPFEIVKAAVLDALNDALGKAWDESKHPRDGGKFTAGAGGESGDKRKKLPSPSNEPVSGRNGWKTFFGASVKQNGERMAMVTPHSSGKHIVQYSHSGTQLTPTTHDTEDEAYEAAEKHLNSAKKMDGDDMELEKQMPGVPSPVATVAAGEKPQGPFHVEQVPNQMTPLELKAGSEPEQATLQTHAVTSKDVSAEMEAWLPKLQQMVKDVVAEALEKAGTWDESKHPREGGKFTAGPGGGGGDHVPGAEGYHSHLHGSTEKPDEIWSGHEKKVGNKRAIIHHNPSQHRGGYISDIGTEISPSVYQNEDRKYHKTKEEAYARAEAHLNNGKPGGAGGAAKPAAESAAKPDTSRKPGEKAPTATGTRPDNETRRRQNPGWVEQYGGSKKLRNDDDTRHAYVDKPKEEGGRWRVEHGSSGGPSRYTSHATEEEATAAAERHVVGGAKKMIKVIPAPAAVSRLIKVIRSEENG